MAHKMVADRDDLARKITTSARVHAAEAAAALRAILGPGLEPGEELPDLTLVFHLLARALDRRRAELLASHGDHQGKLSRRKTFQRLRGEAAAELRARLVQVRQAVAGAYGQTRSPELLGVSGRISMDPSVLYLQAARAAEYLERPAEQWPPPRLPGQTVAPGPWRELLLGPLAELHAALDGLAEQRSRTDGTFVAKKARLAAYDAASGRIARALEALFELAELDFYSDRVRPTRRRKRGRTGAGEEAAAAEKG